MKAADFRRIALSLEGVEEGSHMGAADFRVGGRIFATLASPNEGYGNLMLYVGAAGGVCPGVTGSFFLPIHGGWRRMRRPTFASRKRTRTCWLALCIRHGCLGGRRMFGQRRGVLRKGGTFR
jgi:hypothetical protein